MGRVRLVSRYIFLFIIMCLAILLIFPPNRLVVEGQPTWSFRVEVLSGEYYMGEWGKIRVNITNTDCPDRDRINPPPITFVNIREDVFDEYLRRVEIMVSEGFIENYWYRVENLRGTGFEVYGDYTLYIQGACKGSRVTLTGAGLWFAWMNYGRSLMSWKNVRIDLEAFNPIKFILKGNDTASSTIIEFNFLFPEDVHPDEISIEPSIDIRLIFPGWREYTLENYPLVSHLKLLPYRSFNLTIADFDGFNVLSGAKLIIRRLMYYYDVREYVVPDNGRVKINRLLDDKYQVEVYWNSSDYLQLYPHVYFEQHWSYELASSKIIKTRLFNPKIKTVDMKNATINGARVIFDGVETITVNGSTRYMLVPEGNHSIQVYWKKTKVFDGWVWVGYHPTIYPWITRPAVEHLLNLPIGDIVVQAVDSGGYPVGANFTVIGLNPETSIGNIYSRSGMINLSQVPVGEYIVRAVNVSRVFNQIVEEQEVFAPGPGILSYIELPIHSVELKVVSMDDKPLLEADMIFGPLSLKLDNDGIARIIGIPKGSYKLDIYWRGEKVYSSDLEISSTTSSKINAEVYDIHLRFIDNRGRRILCNYSFTAPGRIKIDSTTIEDELSVEMVPEGVSRLIIKNLEGKLLYNSSVKISDFWKLHEIRLPVDDLVVNVTWSSGEPLAKSEVKIRDLNYGLEYSKFTNTSGVAVFEKMVFSNYSIRVNYPDTPLTLKIFNKFFNGEIIQVQVEKAWLTVRAVDSDGNPIRNAEATIFYGMVSLGRAYTDHNGYAFFNLLPKLSPYTVKVKHDKSELTQTATPNSMITFTFEKPIFTEELLNLVIQLSIIGGIIAIVGIVIYRVAKYVKKSIESIPTKI